jgi:hypothetical protein
MEGDTIARKNGVKVGDFIIAVNGHVFRRFPSKYDVKDIQNLTCHSNDDIAANYLNCEDEETISNFQQGEGYAKTLGKIKEIKSTNDPNDPLTLTLERYGWNSRENAWHRFLAARDGDVDLAMQMMEENEKWRKRTFPLNLKGEGLQKILKSRAISEIDLDHDDRPPTVYVDFSKLQALEEGVSSKDVVDAFVVFTELLLARSENPRNPKTCQFIDLSETYISSGFRVSILKQIYSVFEPNYPETLEKMIMYPVSSFVRRTCSVLLSFVNSKTRNKFIITDDLDVVCKELGWDKNEVEACGGVTAFMHSHEKTSDSLFLEN